MAYYAGADYEGTLNSGDRYTVEVKITYDIYLGGVTAQKSSVGKIHLTAVP
jgi:hypothetical protein